MDDTSSKPSATPFSITDILNRKEIQGINHSSTSSVWERRGCDHHPLPSYLPTSPCLPVTSFNLQAFTPSTYYQCSTQPVASAPKDKSKTEESTSEENTEESSELSKEQSKLTHMITIQL